jgi:hypothetical protein
MYQAARRSLGIILQHAGFLNGILSYRHQPNLLSRYGGRADQCSYWIGGSWIGAGFTLVCFGLDLKLLWIGSEVSGAPGAPKHITHPVIAHRFEAERVGT